MRPRSIKTKIMISFFAVIAVLGVFIGLLGFYVLRIDVIQRAQDQIRNDLNAAESVYVDNIAEIRDDFEMLSSFSDPEDIRKKTKLDYVRVVPVEQADSVTSEIARKAFRGLKLGGTRIIDREELKGIDGDLASRADLEIKDTLKARPSKKKSLNGIMAIEYAMPVYDEDGRIKSVLYGGRVVNGDYPLVDKIRDLVFGNRYYGDKPVGTVTIFQDDVRVSTNVLNEEGERAVGTRVSEIVYDEVIGKGRTWLDRAFVVNDWYLTSYQPIKDIEGNIIGILYVGILEKPFTDMSRNVLLVFQAIVTGAMILAVILSSLLASSISRTMKQGLKVMSRMAEGDLHLRVESDTSIVEMNRLAAAVNDMAERLDRSYSVLRSSNRKLEELNKDYLDLIGFVSHELKGILGSTILNAYSLRDGFLGMVNFKQRKALDSITRNLDYLSATVKNFLSLSRVEKGELDLNPVDLFFKEDVFDISIEAFHRQAVEKKIDIEIEAPCELRVTADPDRMLIVSNNLVSNAIKYGEDNGKVKIVLRDLGDEVEAEVYNDGRVITEEEKGRLFRKFSRLKNDVTRKVRGTGLGLFITKEIVESHGGTIRVEPREKGNAFIFTIKKGDNNGNSA